MKACSIQVSKETFIDLREKQKNGSWLDENFAAIRGEHPDMFVAVFRASMLDIAKTLDELMEKIHKRGIDRVDQIVIRYIPEEDVVIIL
jgi:hypothetical protein